MTNFVLAPDGAVTLIDLEKMRLAPPEWDVSLVAMTATFDRAQADLWPAVRALLGPLDPDRFTWCLRQQVAGSIVWAAWQMSMGNSDARDSVARRLPLAARLLADPHTLQS